MPPLAKSRRSTSGRTSVQGETNVKNDRKTDKKKETLRPWLIDVAVEHLR
jgi:hypothetical protein